MAQLLKLIVSGGNCTVTNDGVITANSYKKSGYDDNYFLLAGGGVKSISQFLTKSTLYEAYLQWGGTNMANWFGPVDAGLEPLLGANRLAFANSDGITIEYSSDNGVTWQTHPDNNSVVQKTGLTSSGSNIYLCGNDSQATASYRLRIIFNTSVCKIYTSLIKFIIYVSINGSKDSRVSIYKALESTPDNYISIAENVKIDGWSGYNVINVQPFTTYNGSTSTATYRYSRIKFEFSGGDCLDNYSGLRILRIMGYGGVGWTTPSTMALTGHLYSYDYLQKATFPNTIYVKTGGFVMSSNSSADNLLTSNGSFITKTNLLSGYATQSWVNSQGFLKYYVNTWRPIQLEGKEVITNATNASLNFSAGTNVTITSLSNNIVISSSYTNTTNTAGSTNSASKLYLIGATSQTSSSTTYSNSTCYIGTDSCLYSNGAKVLTSHQSLSAYALKTDIPTTLPASDVYDWAKASTKPSYSWSEITSRPFYSSIQSGSPTYVWGANNKNDYFLWNTSALDVFRSSIVKSYYTGNGGQQGPLYFGKYNVGFLMMNTTVNGNSNYKDWLIMNCYGSYDAGGAVAIGVNRQRLGAYIMRAKSNYSDATWNESAEIILNTNYTNFFTIPTKVSQLENDSKFLTSYTDTQTTAASANSSEKLYLIGTNTQSSSASTTYSKSGLYSTNNGDLTCVSISESSDINKKNILEYSLDDQLVSRFIDNISTIKFTFKNDEFNKEHIGVIAQEVEEYFPELVRTDEDGYKSVEYSKITAILIQSIRNLKIEIDKLKINIKI